MVFQFCITIFSACNLLRTDVWTHVCVMARRLGFAAFMEHFATDALFPDYKIWEQYTTDAFGSAQVRSILCDHIALCL